jgi:hypothetical protein
MAVSNKHAQQQVNLEEESYARRDDIETYYEKELQRLREDFERTMPAKNEIDVQSF